MVAAGCGDGSVTARGHVMIEGEPASGGRIMLSPVGRGPKAFSAVTEEGEFALRTGSKALGAFPGSYRVTLFQPLDDAARQRLGGQLAGQLSADEFTVVYRGPRDRLLEISEAGNEDLVIDIRKSEGWAHSLSE
jgi:hypothetical protein